MKIKYAALKTIPVIAMVLSFTAFGAADDANTPPSADRMAQIMAQAKKAQADADAQMKAETLKYPMRVPTNDAQQKTLDGACLKGPRAYYTWVAGPDYVKDHADLIQPAWPQMPGANGGPNTMCKMVQIMIAMNLKKYEGKDAGVHYLKASDPQAAQSIAAIESANQTAAQMH